MLGLKRHIVHLEPHNPNWKLLFKTAKKEISEALGDLILDIEHVGSTSIKNIPAKPILDIAVSVSKSEIVLKCIPRLEEIGYIYRGDSGSEGGHLFVKESEKDVRIQHVHFVRTDDPQWKNYLNFRDFMNENPDWALKYEDLKWDLKNKFPHDRKAYTNGKTEFIQSVLFEVGKRNF